MNRYYSIEVATYAIPIIIGLLFYLFEFYKIQNIKFRKWIAVSILLLFSIICFMIKQIIDQISTSQAAFPYHYWQFNGQSFHTFVFDEFLIYYVMYFFILFTVWILVYKTHQRLDYLLDYAKSHR